MKSTTLIEKWIKGAKSKRMHGFKRLGITTIHDLLYHFPVRYQDASIPFDGTLEKGEHISLVGTIEKIGKRRSGGRRRMMLAEATIYTDEQKVRAVWFHQPYIANQYKSGDLVMVSGKLSGTKTPYLTNPTIKHTQETEDQGETRRQEELTAVYPETQYISSLYLRSQIEKLLGEEDIKNIEDPIPEEARKKLHLPDLYNALVYIHKPRSKNEHEAARKRFIFEHTLLMQLTQGLSRNKRSVAKAYNTTIDVQQTKDFMKNRFEFTPTKDQQKAVEEILKDMQNNRPMARLLEGDVGSGKTAVAAAVLHGTTLAKTEEETSGKPQTAYLAPTEVLARQQFNTLVAMFSHLPINIGFISSKECLKFPSKVHKDKPTSISKGQLKKWIASGEIAIIIGTHALIQKDIQFKRLALIIIDEQHRFGVAQRNTLIRTTDSHTPHLLSMTATPIPRTLALTIYGDLDISVLEEMPKGRKPVKTKIVEPKNMKEVYAYIEKEVENGRQAYILCPRIEEDEESPLRSAEEECAHIKKNIFPNRSVDILHGKMKQKEKQEAIEHFREGKTNILVCTTVIEVGINIPNATVMTILHAERFGLAQLHQLRGRVIRSTHQPYCYAITDSKNELTMERLKTFEKNHNGFILAQKDLDLRGSGELAGLRQSGIPDMVMEGIKNPKLLAIAKEEAANMLQKDPTLQNFPATKNRLKEKTAHTE